MMTSAKDSLSSVYRRSIWMWLEVDELMENLGFIGAQNFVGAHFFKIFRNFQEIKKYIKFRRFESDRWGLNLWRHSTSPPSGNQVDGLPLVCSTGAAPACWKPKKCWTIYNFWCFFFEVMRSFIMSRAVSIFRSNFMKNAAWKSNHL